ncbi:reverse transcriptase domain-containing protein [Tanacetum coccineum]
MSRPWRRQKVDAFTRRISDFSEDKKRRMPANVKTYDGTVGNAAETGSANYLAEALMEFERSCGGAFRLISLQGRSVCQEHLSSLPGSPRTVQETINDQSSSRNSSLRGRGAGGGNDMYTPLTMTPKEDTRNRRFKFPKHHHCALWQEPTRGNGSTWVKNIKEGKINKGSGCKKDAIEDKAGGEKNTNNPNIYCESWQRRTKQNVSQNFRHWKWHLLFPNLTATTLWVETLTHRDINAEGHDFHRYCTLMEEHLLTLLYEHCFQRLRPEVKKSQFEPRPRVVDCFNWGENDYGPWGNLRLPVLVGNRSTHNSWMNFMVDQIYHRHTMAIIGSTRDLSVYALGPITPSGCIKFRLRLELAAGVRTIAKNLDIFAWEPEHMNGVPTIDHRTQDENRQDTPQFIKREVLLHDWLSNPVVMVKKRMVVGGCAWTYTDLTKPVQMFLDAYKGYHQIQMDKDGGKDGLSPHARVSIVIQRCLVGLRSGASLPATGRLKGKLAGLETGSFQVSRQVYSLVQPLKKCTEEWETSVLDTEAEESFHAAHSSFIAALHVVTPTRGGVGLCCRLVLLRDSHAGSCSMHSGPRSVVAKSLTVWRWVEELSHVLWAHRTTIKVSTGDTPFSLVYGTEAVIPAEIGMPTIRTAEVNIATNDDERRIDLDILEERREQAAIREEKTKLKMKGYYDTKVRGVSFRPGDFVYRANDASHAEDTGKLGPKWEGPYEVTEALGKGAYKLRDMDGRELPRTWNICNLKKCYL